MGETLAPAVAGWLDAHQARVQPVLHIALENPVLDQDILLRRGAFIIDAERAAASAPDRARDAAVVDHGDPRSRNAFADAAREGARALAIEIALKPVTNRLVQ